MDPELQTLRNRFIEEAGHMTQSFGLGRVIGQIFMHIYFSRTPQTLDDLVESLSISKGSASTTVRQLEQWGALRRVWVKGDRKDYYEATSEFGMIIRKIMFDMVGRTVETTDHLLDEAQQLFQADSATAAAGDEDRTFVESRIHLMRLFRDRANKIWNSSIVKMLLK